MKQILIAIDQMLNAFLGGMADETISARVHRNDWRRVERLIDWLMRDPGHCRRAYTAELLREHFPKSYRYREKNDV